MLRCLILIALLIPALRAALPTPPRPEVVAIVYNSRIPESEKLAQSYARQRDIPTSQLVGLPLPEQEEISREQFDTELRDPLIATFDERRWWQRGAVEDGKTQLLGTKIRILVCMRGVPSRIKHPDPAPDPDAAPADPQQRMMATGNAAVDSELAVLGNDYLALGGPLANPYFQKDSPFIETKLPMFLVGRIDASDFQTCERMIADAIATEANGLWGFAAVDLANKVPQGDGWLRSAATSLDARGIPTLLDRFNETLPLNFPLGDTAIYLGWYDWNVGGPFKSPSFRFKRGAVAVHIHSFSAAQLRDPAKNWCAPLLARGAAATLGNVYEPFLHLTHHLDVFTERLLAGYTLIEAAYMAAPALSWQAVVIGDPLYRPFLRLDGSGKKAAPDKLFRALRIARLRWPDDESEREAQLRAAAARMDDARLLEAIGLHLHVAGQGDRAASVFRDALPRFTEATDRLRMDLHLARIDREAQRKAAAIRQLRTAITTHSSLPGAEAAKAWLNLLDPPPTPPAQTPGNR